MVMTQLLLQNVSLVGYGKNQKMEIFKELTAIFLETLNKVHLLASMVVGVIYPEYIRNNKILGNKIGMLKVKHPLVVLK